MPQDWVTRRTVLRGLAGIVAASAIPLTIPASTPRKWHPGHYVRTSSPRERMTGIKVNLSWGEIEGRKGDYTSGFRLVDGYLDTVEAHDQYLMVQVDERTTGHTGGYPRYVLDNDWVANRPDGEVWRGNLTSAAEMWRPRVMDRLIHLSQAFAARYDAHPRFEQFSLGETALGVPRVSTEAWTAQLKRWFTVSKQEWTATYLRLTANYISNDAGMRDLITHCVNTTAPGGVSIGGPNPEPPSTDVPRFITANRVFRGLDGGADLRGTVPWTGEVQSLGGRTTREITDYFDQTMRATQIVWPDTVGGRAE